MKKILLTFIFLTSLTFGQSLLLHDQLDAPYGYQLFRLADGTYLRTNTGQWFCSDDPLIAFWGNNKQIYFALFTREKFLFIKKKEVRYEKVNFHRFYFCRNNSRAKLL